MYLSACWCLHEDRPIRAPLLPAEDAAEFRTETPFVIETNQIEKQAFGRRPDEISFFKQAAVE